MRRFHCVQHTLQRITGVRRKGEDTDQVYHIVRMRPDERTDSGPQRAFLAQEMQSKRFALCGENGLIYNTCAIRWCGSIYYIRPYGDI